MKTAIFALFSLCGALLCQIATAVPADGLVVGWGDNPFCGCLTDAVRGGSNTAMIYEGKELPNVVSISAHSAALALRGDGTVFGWRNNMNGQAVGVLEGTDNTNGIVKVNGVMLSNIVAVATGNAQSLALKKDGTVVSWGYSGNGMFDVPAGLSNVMAISMGGTQNLALQKNGHIVAWGDSSIMGNLPSRMSNVLAVAIAASPYRDYAITRNGTVAEWYVRGAQPGGSLVTITNDDGSPETGYKLQDYEIIEGLSNVVAIAAGMTHMLALKSDGTVYGRGAGGGPEITGIRTTNNYTSGIVVIGGKPLTNVVVISVGHGSGFSDYSLALRRDGTVVEWGSSPNHSLDPPAGLTNVVAICAGDGFCLALTTSTNLPGMRK